MPEIAPVVSQRITPVSLKNETENVPVKKNYDQYADGKAAKIWDVFVGDRQTRAKNIKSFLVNILRQNGCKRILDAACGTGVDSIVLLEEGFEVVSVDASDQMLKSAYRERWNRRREPAFDNWVIEEANWLTISDDIQPYIEDGFDAIICLGSSFSHLLDTSGDQKEHKQAIGNFFKCLKPGGLLIIDHRNYDQLLKIGDTSESDYSNNVYYNATLKTPIRINTKIHYENGKPNVVTRDYYIGEGKEITELNFSFYPHSVKSFTELLKNVFGENAPHTLYGDFKPVTESDVPTYYIHQIQRKDLV